MQIIHDYRTLHSIPELDWSLPKTVTYIQKQLSSLSCKVFFPVQGAICAYFDFGKPDSIAFRADMDALPIEEQTGVPWKSCHPGNMHACGHDGHTTILLELARKLHLHKNLPHNVLLIFQPAEETDGGANIICQTGILSQYKVCAIFGLHLWPTLPKGQLFSRCGVLMSHSCGVNAVFSGKSVHIANFQTGVDALSACCRFLCRAENLQFPFPFLLKFGKISGGTAGNILCDHAELIGSLRTRSPRHQQLVQTALCKSAGCNGKIYFTEGFPAVCNDNNLWNRVQKKCPVNQLNRTFWTADDFSYYQHHIPGIYYLLGIGNTPPLHSPEFTFDESILSIGADFFLRLCKA